MKRAFTVVELLCCMAIVAILATMGLWAMHSASHAVKRDRTVATIAKIDTYISDIYNSYETRRLPCDLTSPAFSSVPPSNANSEIAGRKLDAMRDLMRMEMPDCWNDVVDAPLVFLWSNGNSWIANKPVITLRIQHRYLLAKNSLLVKYGESETNKTLAQYASAKLLYMVVMSHNPEAAEYFRSDEIARPTEDRLPVFIDGWGNPIKWLRWAPGFDQSTIQPTVIPINNQDSRQKAASEFPDPMNPRKAVRQGTLTAPYTTELGWKLIPLIYSAGPDGIYDISVGEYTHHYGGNPYQLFYTANHFSLGSPTDSNNTSVTSSGLANGSLDHYDNITSHQEPTR
jgi:prepilin-type N-terminal cleavage/methylation domain-containing protein